MDEIQKRKWSPIGDEFYDTIHQSQPPNELMLKTIEKTHKIIDAMPCEMAKKSYFRILKIKHGSSSAVEHWSPKPAVGSSNLSSRASNFWRVGRVVEGARLESV